MSLENQHVLILGGSSGMGRAAAGRLARDGARVTIAGRSQDRLDAAAATIGADVATVVADMTDRASLDAAMRQVGALDHLVLTASGSVAWGQFDQVDGEALARAFQHKLVGYWTALQAALPHLRRDGSVTMLSGAAARSAMPGTAALAAVNGGLAPMARTLAKELAPLRVNVISPGLVDTEVYDAMPAEAKRRLFEGAAQSLPVGRTGRPDDVADAIAFLAGNGFTTGALLDVDGGAHV